MGRLIKRVFFFFRFEKFVKSFDFASRNSNTRTMYSTGQIALEFQRMGSKYNASIFALESCGSTNDEAFRILQEAEIPRKIVVAAEEQTGGRGRLNRRWVSNRGKTICVSMGMSFDKVPEGMASLTVRAGLEICKRLSVLAGARIFVKWPNDLYSWDGGKLAGMLAELRVSNRALFVLGIGLNLEIPSGIPGGRKVSSLSGISREVPRADKLVAEVAEAVFDAAESMRRKEPLNLSEFEKFDWLKGRDLKVECGSRTIFGVGKGITENGELLVESESGRIEKINSGEANATLAE